MTVFVLVPDLHTGGWVWDEVVQALRESGAQAHAVTLTGMGEDGRAGGDADLETHIGDLLRVLDSLSGSDAVLVGHGYGLFPVLGAADRRPDRVARIVSLGAGMPPRDGDTALSLVTDEAVRDGLSRGTGEGDGRSVTAPELDGWRRRGSTAGLSEEALAMLVRRGAPQPPATLTRPLRLSGAAERLPVTGLLCTGDGESIALVEMSVSFGDPRLQVLTEPRWTLLELDTGHWPMLSAPAELAGVLVRAAAGEGHRVADSVREDPPHLRPFPLEVPERPRERRGRVDLHLPEADTPRPAVVFVHGGPLPPKAQPTPRDWPVFTGYGRYAASRGVVGVTVDHELHSPAHYEHAAANVAEAVDLVRADPRVDADRIALWFFSGGGLLSADWLAAPPPWLRCVAASYPILAPLPGWGLDVSRFRPAAAVHRAGRLPFVLTRVGRESPEIAATVKEFLEAAADCGAVVDLVDLPEAHHGFETVDPVEAARQAVHRAADTVWGHLGA
ncbi:alpha/beta fold hydrolase [Streptomyces sp. NPDC059740]|uniref:alpha/beta hydrolase n=1 Tax=Streptomyces sp. NPDC059740 TaxID=3346926 RepID=UPI00365BFE01